MRDPIASAQRSIEADLKGLPQSDQQKKLTELYQRLSAVAAKDAAKTIPAAAPLPASTLTSILPAVLPTDPQLILGPSKDCSHRRGPLCGSERNEPRVARCFEASAGARQNPLMGRFVARSRASAVSAEADAASARRLRFLAIAMMCARTGETSA